MYVHIYMYMYNVSATPTPAMLWPMGWDLAGFATCNSVDNHALRFDTTTPLWVGTRVNWQPGISVHTYKVRLSYHAFVSICCRSPIWSVPTVSEGQLNVGGAVASPDTSTSMVCVALATDCVHRHVMNNGECECIYIYVFMYTHVCTVHLLTNSVSISTLYCAIVCSWMLLCCLWQLVNSWKELCWSNVCSYTHTGHLWLSTYFSHQ